MTCCIHLSPVTDIVHTRPSEAGIPVMPWQDQYFSGIEFFFKCSQHY